MGRSYQPGVQNEYRDDLGGQNTIIIVRSLRGGGRPLANEQSGGHGEPRVGDERVRRTTAPRQEFVSKNLASSSVSLQ